MKRAETAAAPTGTDAPTVTNEEVIAALVCDGFDQTHAEILVGHDEDTAKNMRVLLEGFAKGRSPSACSWVADEDGVYDTSCGKRWEFTAGTPAENGAKFCPYCGGQLVDAAASRPSAEAAK